MSSLADVSRSPRWTVVLAWFTVFPRLTNHVNDATHKADMGRLSQVALYFSSFVDVRGRRTGCDFLDLGDGVGLSPSHDTRGGFCRM
jgi:hypothetical protein